MNLHDGAVAKAEGCKTCGIRPAHVALSRETGRWRGKVRHIERLGAGTILLIAAPDLGILVVRYEGEHDFADGETLRAAPMADKEIRFGWARPTRARIETVMYPSPPADAAEVLEIWPEPPELPQAPAGRTEKLFPNPDPAVPERWIRNVALPSLTRFAAPRGSARSMLVVPGGGFHFVSIDNEGYDVARALAAAGIEAFVLKYRTAPMPEDDAAIPGWVDRFFAAPAPAPGATAPPSAPGLDAGRALGEADGRQAMRFLKANAPKLGIDPDRIGAMGFSAGGGIVADLAYRAPGDCRPAFAVPVYPAWAPGALVADPPPSLLIAASDDPVVPAMSTAALAVELHRAGVPVALHIYGDGGHGFGIRKQGALSDRWFADMLRWIDRAAP